MRTVIKWQSVLAWFTVLLALGCAEPLDTQRRNVRAPTPGESIYEELCNRVAMGDDPHDVAGTTALSVCRQGQAPAPHQGPRLHALHAQRCPRILMGALDAALADGTARASKRLIGALAPLYDDGVMRRAVNAQGNAVAAFAADPAALDALGSLWAREGYVPADLQWGLCCGTGVSADAHPGGCGAAHPGARRQRACGFRSSLGCGHGPTATRSGWPVGCRRRRVCGAA